MRIDLSGAGSEDLLDVIDRFEQERQKAEIGYEEPPEGYSLFSRVVGGIISLVFLGIVGMFLLFMLFLFAALFDSIWGGLVVVLLMAGAPVFYVLNLKRKLKKEGSSLKQAFKKGNIKAAEIKRGAVRQQFKEFLLDKYTIYPTNDQLDIWMRNIHEPYALEVSGETHLFVLSRTTDGDVALYRMDDLDNEYSVDSLRTKE